MSKAKKSGAIARWSTRSTTMLGALALTTAVNAQTAVTLPPDLLAAAAAFAETINGGTEIGGTVSVLGVNGGQELEMLKAAWKPFEDATGVTIDYIGTTDFAAVLQTRVQAGDPPDLAGSTNINNLVRYASQGVLQDITAMIGADRIEGHFDPGLVGAATVDNTMYGVWTELNNFMMWYNVHTYDGPKGSVTWEDISQWADTRATAGSPPWCYTDERGAASGATAGNFIQAYILKNSGPDVLKALAAGEISWTSPEVRAGFEAYGKIVHDPSMVAGGAIAAMSTPAVRIGTGMFSDPGQCSALIWGTYAASLTKLIYPEIKGAVDLDFMQIPGKAEFANYETFGGTVYMAFKNTPQAAAFLTYLASTEGQTLVASAGNWTVANQQVTADAYPDPVLQNARETLLSSDVTLVAQPTQIVDPPVIQALWKGIVQYALDPSSLDTVLASIDAAR